jgi:predicted PurR-regulated permease PerM
MKLDLFYFQIGVLFLLVSTTFLQACGCLDAPSASSGASSIISNYNSADSSLDKQLQTWKENIETNYQVENESINKSIENTLNLLKIELIETKRNLKLIENHLELK